MMFTVAVRSFLTLALFASSLLFSSATPTTTSTTLGCTIWRTGAVNMADQPDCTLSEPWWNSWTSCGITPVHSEPWVMTYPGDQGLQNVPWIKLDSTGASAFAHLFYGNRPLHVGGEFPDGVNAKVLWQVDRIVTDLTLTATKIGDRAQTPVSIPTYATNVASNASQWPSNLSIPTPGCWRVDLDARTTSGGAVKASAVFIVVE